MKAPWLLAPALFALSAPAFAQEVLPNPDEVFIKSINAIGTGCKDPATYSVNLSEDRKAFTLSFSEFIAQLGPGIPLIESRKNCAVTLTLSVPPGFQYSIGTFNYRGFMDLGPKVRAEHSTSYFFQGTGKTGTFSAVEVGPLAKDFVYTDKVGLASVHIPDEWSPCNAERALTLNPSIRVSKLAGAAANAEGVITNDSVDGELKQQFGLIWRKCGATAPNPELPAANKVYTLVSRNSGHCLDVKDHALHNGGTLQQWTCTGEDHQKFRLVDQGAGQFALIGVQSGKTISVESSLQDNGATVLQWDAQNAANQKVKLAKSVDGSYTVRFAHSNKCLDVSDVSKLDGAKVHQWECLNGANQDWFFKEVNPSAPVPPAPNHLYKLVSRNSGLCLDVRDHGLHNGATLQQWACTGEPHQTFRLEARNGGYALHGLQSGKTISVQDSHTHNGAVIHQWDNFGAANQIVDLVPSTNGTFVLKFKHSGKCADVDGVSLHNGAKVHQWDCHKGANQDWHFQRVD